mmetsp:Transcript_84386/g.235432  ORF Transcript_84386/g.235432 Transcript_84386/m.235432 type:complete len:239 (+) Transcript_84386:338-1054(+)
MLLHGLLFVEALQATIHPLVESPRLLHRHVELTRALQGQVARLDRALQIGRETNVHLDALLLEELASALGLFNALFRQVHVHPAREPIRDVPLRLAMPGENQLPVLRGHLGLVFDSLRRRPDLLGVAQVAAKLQWPHGHVCRYRLQVRVQVVDQRRGSRDFQPWDHLVRDALHCLHNRADGVAMRRHEHSLARFEFRLNGLRPIRHHPSDHVLQALGRGDLLLGQLLVLSLAARVILA